jgi:hypothetical protein
MIRQPRGAILLEVLLAIGLFVGAAAFCLGVTKSLFSAFERTDRRRLAIDLARSKLAELEAGLISVQDLRGEWSGGVGSRQDDVELEAGASGPAWEIDAVTTRSEYPGLSLIELTITEVPTDGAVESNVVSFTLRQLVALREQDPQMYEADEMLEGLEGLDGSGAP